MLLSVMMALQVAAAPLAPDTTVVDSLPQRSRSVEYSDAYLRRLQIHQIGSYAMVPLAATEYILGNQLLQQTLGERDGGGHKSAHTAVASGLGAVFAVNTVTGVWNLWEMRDEPEGRTRRTVHAVALLAADAGFLWASSVAEDAGGSSSAALKHRNIALGSLGVATVGSVMMWLWKE